MRSSSLFFVASTLLVYCSGFADADIAGASNNPEIDSKHPFAEAEIKVSRYLRSNQHENEEKAMPGLSNVESLLKRTLSHCKATSFSVEALVKKTPSLNKLRTRSMNEAEIRKAKIFAEKTPELRKMKSLVGTNPQKFTQEVAKSMRTFVEQNPEKGPGIIYWLFGISGLAVILGVAISVIVANRKKARVDAEPTKSSKR
ncbi:hypothetical protein JG687_00015308 [Phytophthora cactorum]|uniref:RxLR effector protein n=1 Tax=Phytophthora cactorum TaxID=29920 RepID=A0A8T1TWL0_9STRA|nr:hypothetical protein PC123_g12259 [Phytophthora cactorum]KAG6948699.1 hypothetical protein JG687_00015308 [Phytophthora cactorum]